MSFRMSPLAGRSVDLSRNSFYCTRFLSSRRRLKCLFVITDGLVRKKSQMQLSQSRSFGEFRTLKKSSSCSTIYIDDSTVSQPNLKNTIKCVSLAIYYHIKNRKSSIILEIFDEKMHPLTVRQRLHFSSSPLGLECHHLLLPSPVSARRRAFRLRQIQPWTPADL